MRIIDTVLNLFFPPKCAFCNEVLSGKAPVCNKCMVSLPFLEENSCRICSRPLEEFSHSVCESCRKVRPHFTHAFIPLIYKDEARRAILNMKRGFHPYYAKAFAYLIADSILSSPQYAKFDYITYVPQNRRSRRERGYNQSELIANELGRLLGIKCVPTLVRTDDGAPQHTLTASQRRENVKKCYFKGNGTFHGTVLLVDDIYTTGSTVNRCSMLLKQMGFEKVYAAVLTIRNEDGYSYEESQNEDN